MEKSPKSWGLCFWLTFFNWGFLVRFLVGDVGGGILRLLTWNLFSILWWVDIIKLFKGTYKDGQGRIVSKK